MSKKLGPKVNFEEVKSIPYRKTLIHCNNFIISTVQFLNRFSFLCEEKLSKVSRDVQRLEITLAILEAKLESIPGIENAPEPDYPDAPGEYHVEKSTANELEELERAVPANQEAANVAPPPQPDNEGEEDVAAPVPQEAVSQNAVKNDPRYQKYFKMLNFGVPEVNVKQKMMAEGVDPSILDNPDAPAEGGGGAAATQPAQPAPPAQPTPPPPAPPAQQQQPPQQDGEGQVEGPPPVDQVPEPDVAPPAPPFMDMLALAVKKRAGGVQEEESDDTMDDSTIAVATQAAIEEEDESTQLPSVSVMTDSVAPPPPQIMAALPSVEESVDDTIDDSAIANPSPSPVALLPEVTNDALDALEDQQPGAPFLPPPQQPPVPVEEETEDEFDSDDEF